MRVMYLWDPSGVLWHITASPEESDCYARPVHRSVR
jgi:hypothetical protein